MPNKIKDLIGLKFGLLTVIERAENIAGRAAWLCQCDCGGTKVVRSSNLQKGVTKSCGCLRYKQLEKLHENNIIDITGQKFGKLLVLEKVGSDYNNNATWLCQCDCGGTKIVASNCLRNGLIQSCGCIKSKNEEKIGQLLREHGIPFVKEKIINDPITHEQYRFDFCINNEFYLEFDGEQHFKATENGWNTSEKLKHTHQKDLNKNQFCFSNNIPLIRIPYNADYKFDDLMLQTSRYILTKENEQKYYENLLTNE